MIAQPDSDVRRLVPADAEKVIAIDAVHSGHSRRRFFDKRFAAARTQPEDYIQLGVVRAGALRGFAIARVLRGEFGHPGAVAVLDAIGVEADWRERGIGQALLEELRGILRRRGVHSLQSQADWTNHDLLHFFDTAGFRLAPRLALQRPIDELLAESSDEL
jgi:GNAT superfamily N-acetyltransferase